MKALNIFITLIIVVILISCDNDYLDRMPLSEISEESVFYTAQDLELYANGFYNDLPGFSIISDDNRSDDVLCNTIPLEQSGERIVSGEPGSDGWSWGALRKINFFFDNYERCDDEQAKKYYAGVAAFFRAYFYYNKVTRFGDVPWYDHVISTSDEEALMKPRDSRVFITQKMIEDLDMAISSLGTERTPVRITKWTALALKSRICLYEGTYRKYHTELELDGADSLLELAWKAADLLMTQGAYKIYSTGDHNKDYLNLFASDELNEEEVILGRKFTPTAMYSNNINYYFLSTTMDDVGLTKEIVNSYLQKDGTPFTQKPEYYNIDFFNEMQDRDPRLAQTVRSPGYKRIGGNQTLVPNFGATTSGYQIVKFVSDESQDGYNLSYQDIPIIRYAEVLLNYAEAKAELGKLSQDDLDKSIGLLRRRVGMPLLSLENANSNPDPVEADRYPNVIGSNKGVILEIRRERRVELVLEGFRYIDLMRWKAGKLLEKHFKGMYFKGYGEFDLDNDGTNDILVYPAGSQPNPTTSGIQELEVGNGSFYIFSDGSSGNLIPFYNRNKSFDENRDYLYPISQGDLQLNPNLTQNPNW